MYLRIIGIMCLFLFVLIHQGTSQTTTLSNLRQRELVISSKFTQIDTLPLFPSSLKVYQNDTLLSPLYYEVNYSQKKLSIKSKIGEQKVTVFYRVIPNDWAAIKYNRDSLLYINRLPSIEDFAYEFNPFEEGENKKGISFNDYKGIDYSGSYSRGLSFGNNQNLSLNSNFNLQMSGNLGNDIEVNAALTDNNIPIQPEGNTQQLQEFDRIFIQLKRNNTQLTAGDFDQPRPDGYFLNYFKKMQGASVSHIQDLGNRTKLKVEGGVAIARGKFSRNSINAIEGNQGPYRLQGANGERFIIILANTERVYIDGILLQRGSDADYIIDYNRGEIIFTPKQLMTKDKRIIVEMEYSDQNYLRSNYVFQTSIERQKIKGYFNYFSEQDSKTSVNSFELNNEIISALKNAGDSPNGVFTSGIDTLQSLETESIRYKIIDSLVTGFPTPFRILVLSSNPDSAIYTAKFSEVGIGRGSYIPIANGLSGRSYAWVAPDPITGALQGTFEPVVRLSPPRLQRLMTAGAIYKPTSKSIIQSEIALSNLDLNRYSSLGSFDDNGLAFYTKAQHIIPLTNKDTLGARLKLTSTYELTQPYFNPIAPYRQAEFSRDWNLNTTSDTLRITQQLVGASVALEQTKLGRVLYGFNLFSKKEKFIGTKHDLNWQYSSQKLKMLSKISVLNSEANNIEKGVFIRPNASVNYQLPFAKWLTVGGWYDEEINKKTAFNSDSLTALSYGFRTYKFNLQTTENDKFGLNASYLKRNDFMPSGSSLVWKNGADEYGINGNWNPSPNQQLNGNFTYRQLSIPDSVSVQETYLGRADYQLSAWKGIVRLNSNYEIGSGQEQKISYSFEPIFNGQGNYFYVKDYNDDGLKQINEFEQIPVGFSFDTTYVRLTLLTNEFIRTNNVQFNQSISLDPKVAWNRDTTKVKKLLSKWSIQSNWRVVRRVKDVEGISQWNPFNLQIADTALVVLNSAMRHSVTFNRAHPIYDLQYNFIQNNQRNILTSGYESRANIDHQMQARVNIRSNLESRLIGGYLEKNSDSEFFDNQDYRIVQTYIRPQISYFYKRNLRATLYYKWQQGKNINGNEEAKINDFKMELTFNKSSRNSVRSSFTWALVDYVGDIGTPTQFSLLEGLQKGKNYLWNLNYDQSLGKNMILSISYEGRKTGVFKTVHIGRAQVRANF